MDLLGFIGAGVNLLGNILGFQSNSNTNHTNMQIARENNAWSEKMMQKQMDYNTLMWEQNNKYNSASAQRKRLEEAGMNPYMMMSGGNAGTAQSAGGVWLPSPSQPTMQAFRPDTNSIVSALVDGQRVKNETKATDSSVKNMDMQTSWYGAKAMADISKAVSEVKNTELKSYYQGIQNMFAKDMIGQQYINQIRQNENLQVQTFNALKTGVLLDKEITHYDALTNAKVADFTASAALKMATEGLTKKQFDKMAQEIEGLRLQNREKDAIFEYVKDKAMHESKGSNVYELFGGVFRAGQDWYESPLRWWNKW